MEFNAAHLHLLLNHVPILGAVAAAGLLTLAFLVRREVLTKAALWTLAVAGVVAVPVYLSGEQAEDIVEELGAPHAVIEPHEEAALITVIVLGALALGAIGALWWISHQRRVPRWLTGTMWVAAAIGALMAGRTAYLGGQIRHTEIRPPEVRQELESATGGEEEGEEGAASAGDTAADAEGATPTPGEAGGGA